VTDLAIAHIDKPKVQRRISIRKELAKKALIENNNNKKK